MSPAGTLQSIVAPFSVADGTGKSLGTVVAEKCFYPNQDQPATEVGIRSTPMADLYIIVQSADPTKQIASIALILNPGVFWIWVGALITLIGGVIVGWPQRVARQAREMISDAERLVSTAAAE